MNTGHLFPLQAFETAMRDDSEVRGTLYTGSLGAGTADRFSDLDIELWVTDAAYARAQAKLREILERLGVVQFLYYRGAATATGFVGPAWQRVDLALLTRDAIQPRAAYARARIVTDTDDVLARAVAVAPGEAVAASWDQARTKIEECVDSQIYLALHNARGRMVGDGRDQLSVHGPIHAPGAPARPRVVRLPVRGAPPIIARAGVAGASVAHNSGTGGGAARRSCPVGLDRVCLARCGNHP
jgi:hypothetical protein